MKTFNDYVITYKKTIGKNDIQIAYEKLLKYVMQLKANCQKKLSDQFTFGNISPGYMDFTYFPFFNEFLRSQKLRFGVVLNHQKIQFELWLMGQNREIQEKYWQLLKTSGLNKYQLNMPQYSILEFVLIEDPNFNQLNILTQQIEEKMVGQVDKIIGALNHIIK